MRELGFFMIFLGIILFFMAALLPLFSIAKGAEISGGGCIVILFFPICFGYGKASSLLILVSLILVIVLMAFSYLIFRTISRGPVGYSREES
ncbi:MAG: hypothetical protein ACP5JF_07535 [Candidatus Methanodesulfokora sp.]|jgi:uncharacterized membrane protein